MLFVGKSSTEYVRSGFYFALNYFSMLQKHFSDEVLKKVRLKSAEGKRCAKNREEEAKRPIMINNSGRIKARALRTFARKTKTRGAKQRIQKKKNIEKLKFS